MSQGSNFKKEVMEALFNAPTNLITNKAILWADSNLPNEGGNGNYTSVKPRVYDHSKDSLWDAIGMGVQTMEDVHDKFRDGLFAYIKAQDRETITKSEVFQHMESLLGHDGIMYLAVHGFMKHYEAMQDSQLAQAISGIVGGVDDSAEGLDALKKAIEDLKRSLKGGKK